MLINFFGARKKYLLFLHEIRLKELEEAKQEAILGLQKAFTPKTKRYRRRKR